MTILISHFIDLSFTERQKRMTVANSDSNCDQRKDEEEWLLRDVIFVEDVRSVPMGRVLKVDGAYAAVRFPTAHTRDAKDVDEILQECRLMRKDDLQVTYVSILNLQRIQKHLESCVDIYLNCLL